MAGRRGRRCRTAVAVMLLAAGAAGCGHRAGRSATPGHLDAGDPTTTDAPIRIGETLAYGTVVLENTGHDDVVLRRAVASTVRGPVEIVGTGVHSARSEIVGAGPWPPYPDDPLLPVSGARLAPGEHLQLVLGLRRTAAGPIRVAGIEVRYDETGLARTATLDQTFTSSG